jgi:hypothetical protein
LEESSEEAQETMKKSRGKEFLRQVDYKALSLRA